MTLGDKIKEQVLSYGLDDAVELADNFETETENRIWELEKELDSLREQLEEALNKE